MVGCDIFSVALASPAGFPFRSQKSIGFSTTRSRLASVSRSVLPLFRSGGAGNYSSASADVRLHRAVIESLSSHYRAIIESEATFGEKIGLFVKNLAYIKKKQYLCSDNWRCKISDWQFKFTVVRITQFN